MGSSPTRTPPIAPRQEPLAGLARRAFVDPCYWLREKGTPEVVEYLEAENAYTAGDDRGDGTLLRRALRRDAGSDQARPT